MITHEQRTELRRLADAATPGPWLVYEREQRIESYAHGMVADSFGIDSADAAFIAAARTAVPALLAALAEVESERNACAAALANARDDIAQLRSQLEAAQRGHYPPVNPPLQ